ncbi:MAG: asparagine synthase (glutamine-hydrolyzing) [Alphaproteobacteria bacterium]
MCGIAGFIRRDGAAPDAALLSRLADALSHRGPDGSGRHVTDDVGMVQTRLAIIDLATGDQPLYGPSGHALVANGEIYNYKALREALGVDRLQTQSDCEPPLALYADGAEASFDQLRGMYAIALHDPARRRVVLTRDPFGIKPLYIAETTDGVAFASEAKALIAAGVVPAELDLAKAEELLQLQFTTGADTAFSGITRVLPGETLVIEGGHIVSRRLRPALPSGGPEPVDEAAALATLDRVLTDSTRVHLQSDVGYGMFLSGGIDSSVLLSLIAREADHPVRAYTAGFPGTNVHDERDAAAALAKRCGAEHVEVDFTAADFWSLLPQVAAALDDPCADYAALPTFKLAGVAAEEQKVVLMGEGGDELFGGYGRYRAAMRPWWRGGKRPRGRGIMDGLGVLRTEDQSWRDGILSSEIAADQGGRSRLQVAQALDCADWLPQDLLTKLDRCLMAHGLEGRTPFLDPEVAQMAFRLPDRLKVRGRTGKWLLRQLLEQLAPGFGAFERKRGFTVPVAEWIRARPGNLAEMVAAQPGVQQLCRPDAIKGLFSASDKRAGQAAWSLLFFATWHQIHIGGAEPAGSPEETLAQR